MKNFQLAALLCGFIATLGCGGSTDSYNEDAGSADSLTENKWEPVCTVEEQGEQKFYCEACITDTMKRDGGACLDEMKACDESPDCRYFSDCTDGNDPYECAADNPEGAKIYREFYECVCDVCHELCCFSCQGEYGQVFPG